MICFIITINLILTTKSIKIIYDNFTLINNNSIYGSYNHLFLYIIPNYLYLTLINIINFIIFIKILIHY